MTTTPIAKHGTPGEPGYPHSGRLSSAGLRLLYDANPTPPAPKYVGKDWHDLASAAHRDQGLSADNAKKLNAILTSGLADHHVMVRVSSDLLEKILIHDGRFKSQHESGSSGGAYNPDTRRAVEIALHGVDVNTGASGTIYGYMHESEFGGLAVGDGDWDDIGQYGNVVVKLKSHKRADTTVTFGDSLDNSGVMMIGATGAMDEDGQIVNPTRAQSMISLSPTPLDDPTHVALPRRQIINAPGIIEQNDNGGMEMIALSSAGYIEAQVHGGVSGSDIEEIIFTAFDAPSSYLVAEMARRNIAWRVVASGYEYDEETEDWGGDQYEVIDQSAPVAKRHFDPSQPRDDQGQWTRTDRVAGRGLDVLFPDGAPRASVPWPATGRLIGIRPYDRDAVIELMNRPATLQDVDPTDLRAMQPAVTRQGVQHYIAALDDPTMPLYSRTPSRLNEHATIYFREDGQKIILSGHHRAAASLVTGRPLRARVVRGEDPQTRVVYKHGRRGEVGYNLLHPGARDSDQIEFDRLDWTPTMTRDEAEVWSRQSALQHPLTFVGRRSSVEKIKQSGFHDPLAPGRGTSAGSVWGDGLYFGAADLETEEGEESDEYDALYEEWNGRYKAVIALVDEDHDAFVQILDQQRADGLLTREQWVKGAGDLEKMQVTTIDLWRESNPMPEPPATLLDPSITLYGPMKLDVGTWDPETHSYTDGGGMKIAQAVLVQANVRNPATINIPPYNEARLDTYSHIPGFFAAYKNTLQPREWEYLTTNSRIVDRKKASDIIRELGYDALVITQYDEGTLESQRQGDIGMGFDSNAGGPQVIIWDPKLVTVISDETPRYMADIYKARGEALLKHGTHDQKTHGRRGSVAALLRRGKQGGFTFNTARAHYPSTGYVVAVSGHSRIFTPEAFTDAALVDFIDENLARFESNPGLHLGGWYDRKNDEMVLDVVELFDNKSEAIHAGQLRNEQAIFDLENLEEIPTGGSGGREEIAVVGKSVRIPYRRWHSSQLAGDDSGGEVGLGQGRAWADRGQALLKHGTKGEAGYSLLHPRSHATIDQPGARVVSAVLDGQEVGYLVWLDENYQGKDYAEESPGVITYVWVNEDHRREGIASQLLDEARRVDSRVHHSAKQSPDGAAWAAVSKHGTKGEPGYQLLHPRSRSGEITSTRVTDRIRANTEKWMADRHFTREDLYANTLAILDRADPASLSYGQKWYATAHEVAIDLHTRYPGTSVEQAAGILAALSPRNKWRYPDDPKYLVSGNVADAYRAVQAIHTPRDIDVTRKTARRAKKMYKCDVDHLIGTSIHSDDLTPLQRAAIDPLYKGMSDNVKKTARIAHGEDPDDALGGPKVRSFYNNILDVDDSESVTIDSHQVRAMIGRIDLPDKAYDEIASNDGRYAYFAEVVQQIGRERGIPPHVVQAITWEQWRREHPAETREAENPSNIATARDTMIGDKLYPAPIKAKTPKNRSGEED